MRSRFCGLPVLNGGSMYKRRAKPSGSVSSTRALSPKMIWLRFVIACAAGMLSWRGIERRENARVRAAGWAAAAALLFAVPGVARAAEIAWRAPDECQRSDVAAAQVEKLVGQPLA